MTRSSRNQRDEDPASGCRTSRCRTSRCRTSRCRTSRCRTILSFLFFLSSLNLTVQQNFRNVYAFMAAPSGVSRLPPTLASNGGQRIKQRATRANPEELGNELEQAALAKVYEGILGLQAAKNLKLKSGADNNEREVKPGSLAEATANLMKAFGMQDSGDVKSNRSPNLIAEKPRLAIAPRTATIPQFPRAGPPLTSRVAPALSSNARKMQQFGNLLQAQRTMSTPNQRPIAGNMNNFVPGTMGKWQSHAAEPAKVRMLQTLLNNNNNFNNNNKHLPYWSASSDNGAVLPGWNSGAAVAAAAAAAVTTPAPAPASLTNWANRNLAHRMMLFNKHLVRQTAPAISVTENEKFIRWRDNGREFVPVEAAPGRPSSMMRMMMTPTTRPGATSLLMATNGMSNGGNAARPAMNDFYWANRVFPTGNNNNRVNVNDKNVVANGLNNFLMPGNLKSTVTPTSPKPTGWARFLPENLDAGIAAAAAAAVTATPAAPVKPIDWRRFLPENLAKIANRQQNEHLKASGSAWTMGWKRTNGSSSSPTEDEGFVVIGEKWIPFYKPFQAPGLGPCMEEHVYVHIHGSNVCFGAKNPSPNALINLRAALAPLRLWREDQRCGPDAPVEETSSSAASMSTVPQCNPLGSMPCCSPFGYCGQSKDHCDCRGCSDFRKMPLKILLPTREIRVIRR